jgi:hypothetical protein
MDGGEAREALLRNRQLVVQRPAFGLQMERRGTQMDGVPRKRVIKNTALPASSCWVCMSEFDLDSDAASVAKKRAANERALRALGPRGYSVPGEFHGNVETDLAYPGFTSCGHMICKKCFDDLQRTRLKCFCADPESFVIGASWLPIQTAQELSDMQKQCTRTQAKEPTPMDDEVVPALDSEIDAE